MRTVITAVVIVSALPTVLGEQAQSPGDVGGQKISPYELSTIFSKMAVPIDLSKPVRVPSGIVAGAALDHKTLPVIPLTARCSHVGGVVVMPAIIGRDGHVKSIEAVSGAEVMRQPYTDAVRQWVYRPFQIYGQPVEVDTTITLILDFNGGGCPP